MENTTKLRAFIAIGISDKTRSEIGRFQDSLKRDGIKAKWVKPHNIHLTLSFLGNIENNLALEIVTELKRLLKDFNRFEFRVNSVGFFPNQNRPKVFWADIDEGSGKIVDLRALVQKTVHNYGFEMDTRNFKPHLTICRFREKPDSKSIDKMIRKGQGKNFGFTRVDKVILFRSDLRSQGPVYSKFSSILLK